MAYLPSFGIAIPGCAEKDGRVYRIVQNKWVGLTRTDEGLKALYRALAEFDPIQPGTLGELMNLYLATGMDELRPATRRDYEKILPRLNHHFGHIRVNRLSPKQISMWLEARRKAGRGAVRANREFAVLSSVHKFGMRQGWVEFNPCRGVSRNKERPRKTFVTNEQFLDGFNRSPEAFQDLIAAAYLSGVRQTDIINWTRMENLKPEGIKYSQSKTGKTHHIEWTDALRYFIRRAMERAPSSEFVFTNQRGKPWTIWAINSQKRRLKLDWCFKDLRAKAQTDSPHSVLGHGAALEAVYRKTLRTRPVR